MKDFKQVQLDDLQSKRLQDNLKEFFLSFQDNVLLDNAVLLQDVALTSGAANRVLHRLNRTLIGYLVIRKSANSQIWDTQTSNSTPSQSVDLWCSTSCTVSLLVF